MRAATTSRLKSSFSTSPRKMRAERVLEHRVQPVDVDVGVRRPRLHAEVVQPDRRLVRRRHPVRPLVEHLEAHALQHRQAVGQRHRRAAVEELEAQHARLRLERAIEAHARADSSAESRAIISMSGTAARAVKSSR